MFNNTDALERAKRDLFPVRLWRVAYKGSNYDVLARSFNEAYEELRNRINTNNNNNK